MEILDFSLTALRNEKHNEFHVGFSALVNRFGAEALGVQTLFPPYTELFSYESDALHFIRKNDITDEMVECDYVRDTTLRGFAANVKSACFHFNVEKRKAGERIQIVLDEFGDIASKPFDEETTSINSLVSKLSRDYSDEVALLSLNDWLNELLLENEAYGNLANLRYTKETTKSHFRMKEVRRQVDAAYKAIVKRINALLEINGPSAYGNFISELNLRIEKFSVKRNPRDAGSDKESTSADAPAGK